MELLDLGKKPVSESKPAGADARYEPEYDELQQEIDKLSNANAGGAVDWKHVVKLGAALLRDKSKDLKVASYLGVGLMHLKGIEGLSAGAQIMLDMISEYWDTLFPAKKRMRGRFGAITWWIENAEKTLKGYDGDELPAALVKQLSSRIEELDGTLAEKSEDAPMIRDLSGYIQRLPVQQEQATVEEEAEKESAPSRQQERGEGDTAVTAPVQPVISGNFDSPEECNAALQAGLSALEPVADYLLANDLADSAGYRLRRMAAWERISSLPPAENGRTMIPAPGDPVTDSIANQLKAGEAEGALRAAESSVGAYLFWLDLSRLSAEALQALGDGYEGALAALENEVSLYVKRLPGLPGLAFADGTPFADARTKSWIQSIGKSSGGAKAGDSEKSPVGAIMTKAGDLLGKRQLVQAVTVINEGCNSVPSARERFRLKQELTAMLTAEGQAGVARIHGSGLLEHIDRFGLEDWEPQLALSGLKVAYETLLADGSEESAAKAGEILQRISRLSPADALKINGFE